MFGSTAILPPRTKRWAEAKVLADCINVKVCSILSYSALQATYMRHPRLSNCICTTTNTPSHSQTTTTICASSQTSPVGGVSARRRSNSGAGLRDSESPPPDRFRRRALLMGCSCRHRVLAELLEQGTRSTLKIPSAYPTPTPSAALMAAQALDPSQAGLDAMRVLGLNPNQALQHPGFYYYMAARCTERRRERFLTAIEVWFGSLNRVGCVGIDVLLHCFRARASPTLPGLRMSVKLTI